MRNVLFKPFGAADIVIVCIVSHNDIRPGDDIFDVYYLPDICVWIYAVGVRPHM